MPAMLAVTVSPQLLVVSLLVGVLAAFLAYNAARRFEAAAGVPAWHLPAAVWALIFFFSWLIGLVLFLVAKATTRPRPPRGGEAPHEPRPSGPAPIAGWYPDPSRRHELRYWDGKGWTDHVRDGEAQTLDAD